MTRREPRHEGADDAHELRLVIGENIKLAQAEAEIRTVDELARKVGISVRLVQKHRAGDNAPGHENLLVYSRVLGKPVAWFFERHQELAA